MTHAQRGRSVENAGMVVGLILLTLIVLAFLAIQVGLVAHPGAPIPKWLVIAAIVPLLPKSLGVVTKGKVWNLLGKDPPE